MQKKSVQEHRERNVDDDHRLLDEQQRTLNNNKWVFATLIKQAMFLNDYFDPDSEPRYEDEAYLQELAESTPLLDYLYDKQLQLDMNTKSSLFDAELDLSCSSEQFVNELEVSMGNNSRYVGAVPDWQIKSFRTLYRFRYDNRLQDHSHHYQQAFIPFYRFSKHKNFSQAVGNTMKRNIRLLYDYVRGLTGDLEVCPCIVLYNLFIRDNFRLFSLVSMQHFNYVRILDDRTKQQRVITYVELTNQFPQISQWFPSINNQYVKKYGPHTCRKLRYYVNLTCEGVLRNVSGGGCEAGGEGAAYRVSLFSNDDEFTIEAKRKKYGTKGKGETSGTACGTDGEGGTRSKAASSTIATTNAKRTTTANRKRKTAAANVITRKKGNANISAANGGVYKKIRLEHLFAKTRKDSTASPRNDTSICDTHILDKLFRSNYVDCKHPNLVRVYVQLRSGDESATLVVRCSACGKRL